MSIEIMKNEADVNQKVWKNIYSEGKGDLKYPNDLLVRVSSNLIPKNTPIKLLDFGFGTGANTLHFANMGFEVHGLEISPIALSKTKEKLSSSGFNCELNLYNPLEKILYKDNTFDVIIAWQVLYYNNWDSLKPVIQDLKRVLKDGGLFIACIAAPGDISHVLSESLGDSLYQSKVSGQEGCIMIIPPKEELSRFFEVEKLDIGFFEFQYSSINTKHWIVTFKK